jgi:predicted metal-dependent phosphoesterase TrpH
MLNIDLHCHSNVSDGLLSPAEVVRRAAAQGVQVLALTDHDDVAGLEEAREAARETNLHFVNGVEISTSWGNHTLHVLGLNIDPAHAGLQAGLEGIRQGRAERATRIAAKFDELGIEGSLAGAYAMATNKGLIGRMHFARFLVEFGYVKNLRTVFKKYLIKGKPGYVTHQWAPLAEAVSWIRDSGGIAVLAHPGRYQIGRMRMEELLAEFKEIGGGGIEVVTSSHTPEMVSTFADLSQRFGFLASRGSDFHGPGENIIELGRLPNLPEKCQPVWHAWGEAVVA